MSPEEALHEARVLGDYVHIDVSSEFSTSGKWAVAIYWLLSVIVGIAFISKPKKEWLAFFLGIGMVGLRKFLALPTDEDGQHLNPEFRVKWALPTEVMMYISAVAFMKQVLIHFYPTVIRNLRRWTLSDGRRQYADVASLYINASIISAMWTPMVARDLLQETSGQTSEDEIRSVLMQVATRAGSVVGSAFTVTGSFHNVLLVCLAYDTIGWLDFFWSTFLPVAITWALSFIAILKASSLGSAIVPEEYERVSCDPRQLLVSDLELKEIEQDSDGLSGDNISSSDDGDHTTTLPYMNPEEEVRGKEANLSIPGCCVVLSVGAMLVCYALGWDVHLVAIVVALVLFGIGLSALNPFKQIFTLDMVAVVKPVVRFVGTTLLMQSFTDTGFPAAIYAHLFLYSPLNHHNPVDCFIEPDCMMPGAILNYFLALAVGPEAAVYWLASIFPYIAPYGWVQISFQLSMATMVRSVVEPINKMQLTTWRKAAYALSVVLFCLVGLMTGVVVLEKYHTVPECSARLGECEN